MSATKAGINLLPQIVTMVIILIATGRIIARTGRYVFLIVVLSNHVFDIYARVVPAVVDSIGLWFLARVSFC